MKTGKFTLVIAVAALLAACSKEDSIVEDKSADVVSALAAPPSAATVSGWESGYSWTQSDSSNYKIYTYSKSFSELTSDVIENGAVLVFVKNAPYEDAILDKPMPTPFHVLPPIGRPGYDQMWYRVATSGNIAVKYRTNKHIYGAPVQAPDGNIQFRYFIVPPPVLNRLGHTPASVTALSYSELVQVLGVAGE